MRLKFTISYDGSSFFGSQQQPAEPHQKTVVGEVNRVFNELNISEKTVFSSRTDRGVHSTGQVFNIDVPAHWEGREEELKAILNRRSDDSISFKRVERVSDSFHSRYSAKSRTYHYIISNSNGNPFQSRYVTFNRDFNFDIVKEHIKIFEGVHDFKGFSKSRGGTESYKRDMMSASLHKYRGVYILRFKANGFVRSQIRLIVGSLIALSRGTLTPQQIREQLNGEAIYTRKVAPPSGLYLSKVSY